MASPIGRSSQGLIGKWVVPMVMKRKVAGSNLAREVLKGVIG